MLADKELFAFARFFDLTENKDLFTSCIGAPELVLVSLNLKSLLVAFKNNVGSIIKDCSTLLIGQEFPALIVKALQLRDSACFNKSFELLSHAVIAEFVPTLLKDEKLFLLLDLITYLASSPRGMLCSSFTTDEAQPLCRVFFILLLFLDLSLYKLVIS